MARCASKCLCHVRRAMYRKAGRGTHHGPRNAAEAAGSPTAVGSTPFNPLLLLPSPPGPDRAGPNEQLASPGERGRFRYMYLR